MAWLKRFELKYFAKIDAAQQATRAAPPERLPPFDLSPFFTRSRLRQALVRFFFRKVLPAAFAVLRAIGPNPRFGRLVVVTRDEDVREVLDENPAFEVPFDREMTELADGTHSVLGLEGGAHDRLRNVIAAVLEPDDLAEIARWSRAYADSLLDASGGRIDVVTDLITRTATESCCRYFGLSVNDPVAFAHWTIAVSSLLFADPFGDPDTRKLALNGAARVRAVLEDAVARVHENDRTHPGSRRTRQTLVDRLMASSAGLTDAEVVATLMGMAAGFIPTNTLAAGNMLEELLADPELMRRARRAARKGKGDAAALADVLWEAARRNPALSPGQWRHVVRPATIAAGSARARTVKRGDIVLAAVASALRDPRAARPSPQQAAALIFGFGHHSCLGSRIAMAHIVSVFMALLRRDGLRVAGRRHGWMQRMGVFPIRLDMTFESPTSTQSMIIVSVPVKDGTARSVIEREIDALDAPARQVAKRSLTRSNIVHFASLSIIAGDRGGKSGGIILLEINADGPRDRAFRILAKLCRNWLGPVLAHGRRDGRPFEGVAELEAFLERHALDLHCYPWGPIGIHYNGTAEFSVEDIARQQGLADFARDALNQFFHRYLGEGGRAMEALLRVRRLAKQDAFYRLMARKWKQLLRDSERFEFSLVRPSRKRLELAEWQEPKSKLAPLGSLARSCDGVRILAVFGFLAVAAAAGLILIVDPYWLTSGGSELVALHNLLVVLAAGVGGILVAILLTVMVIAGLALELLRHERADVSDDRPPEFEHVREIAAREDRPGCEQNHIIAAMPLKPGPFRKLVFAFALWGIKQSVHFWFRPGFVVSMGTIHYAKWFRVPGTQQFVFLSNYDGNWESYLEDFITRAHPGQTAAWSNGVGFPRTRLLILDGARDGDRFKRWVRRQQRVTRFWYSRFPNLTTKQIRNNAIIEHGLANAVSDTDARRWLACFGSAQREVREVETSEAQSILFSGFGNMHHASCLVLRLPDNPRDQFHWLKAMIGRRVDPIYWRAFGRAIARPDLAGRREQPASPDQPARPLPAAARIAFGDHPVAQGAAVLGLSSAGLEKLGLGTPSGIAGLAEFPAPFNFGMARRDRVLGDQGDDAPDRWLWRDTTGPDGKAAADGVLIVYGQLADDEDGDGEARRKRGRKGREGGSRAEHEKLVRMQAAFLRAHGGEILHIVPTGPLMEKGKPTLHREHFGFRDGISQPVIRGTQRAAAAPPPRDLAEPGEFLLGYLNNQGYYPPLISVAEETDKRNDLPILNPGPPGRFPRFGSGVVGANARDFGRNGSFLVIRQFDQDVRGFWRGCRAQAREVSNRYWRLDDLLGLTVDKEWIAAKLVGRWIDGKPLVGNPTPPARGETGEHPDNDFAYGVDDPRGFQCPLGAHIRRSNPRDSLEPGDPSEQFITNRHRLLRRGRAYRYAPDLNGAEQKGLLFMALCADIERQFEFVQHTWINASSFHGLTGEPDPIAGPAAPADQSRSDKRSFTIPMPGGAIVLENMNSYVNVRAGGYFFLPSVSALRYLCSLAAGSAFFTRPSP